MNTKPILFQGDMIRALLREIESPCFGKTMTRRAVKPTKCRDFGCELAPGEIAGEVNSKKDFRLCPYGKPGDLLWVRDTHHLSYHNVATYRANFSYNPFSEDECGEDHSMVGEKWNPSIFMPRWASRITLQITGVRVERLRDISEADARAEGIFREHHEWRDCDFPLPPVAYRKHQNAASRFSDPREAFRDLWQSINGADSWTANPWVWVVEFRPILANVDAVLADPGQFGIKNAA